MKLIDVQALLTQINALFKENSVNPPNVSSTMHFVRHLEGLVAYRKMVDLLEKISAVEDATAVIEALNTLFHARWDSLSKLKAYGDFAYLSDPTNPANIIYLAAATAVADALDEPSNPLLLVMTTVEINPEDDIGVCKPANDLHAHEFILSDDGTRVIEIWPTIDLAKRELPLKYFRDQEWIELSESEEQRICRQSEQANICITTLKKLAEESVKQSMGEELKQLRIALQQGSTRGQGEEKNAAEPANIGIVKFSNYFKSLSKKSQEFILNCKNTSDKSFRDVWSLLARDKNTNYEQVKFCLNIIGNDLELILDNNPQLFSSKIQELQQVLVTVLDDLQSALIKKSHPIKLVALLSDKDYEIYLRSLIKELKPSEILEALNHFIFQQIKKANFGVMGTHRDLITTSIKGMSFLMIKPLLLKFPEQLISILTIENLLDPIEIINALIAQPELTRIEKMLMTRELLVPLLMRAPTAVYSYTMNATEAITKYIIETDLLVALDDAQAKNWLEKYMKMPRAMSVNLCKTPNVIRALIAMKPIDYFINLSEEHYLAIIRADSFHYLLKQFNHESLLIFLKERSDEVIEEMSKYSEVVATVSNLETQDAFDWVEAHPDLKAALIASSKKHCEQFIENIKENEYEEIKEFICEISHHNLMPRLFSKLNAHLFDWLITNPEHRTLELLQTRKYTELFSLHLTQDQLVTLFINFNHYKFIAYSNDEPKQILPLANEKFALMTREGNLKIYNTNAYSTTCEPTILGPDLNISAMCSLPNNQILVGTFSGELIVYNWETGEQIKQLAYATDREFIDKIQMVPGDLIIATTHQGHYYLLDYKTSETKLNRKTNDGYVTLTAISQEKIVSVKRDGFHIRIANPMNATKTVFSVGHTAMPTCAVVLPNGYCASGGKGDEVRVWDPQNARLIHKLNGEDSTLLTDIIVLNDSEIAVATESSYCVYNFITGTQIVSELSVVLEEYYILSYRSPLIRWDNGCLLMLNSHNVAPMLSEWVRTTPVNQIEPNMLHYLLSEVPHELFANIPRNDWVSFILRQEIEVLNINEFKVYILKNFLAEELKLLYLFGNKAQKKKILEDKSFVNELLKILNPEAIWHLLSNELIPELHKICIITMLEHAEFKTVTYEQFNKIVELQLFDKLLTSAARQNFIAKLVNWVSVPGFEFKQNSEKLYAALTVDESILMLQRLPILVGDLTCHSLVTGCKRAAQLFLALPAEQRKIPIDLNLVLALRKFKLLGQLIEVSQEQTFSWLIDMTPEIKREILTSSEMHQVIRASKNIEATRSIVADVVLKFGNTHDFYPLFDLFAQMQMDFTSTQLFEFLYDTNAFQRLWNNTQWLTPLFKRANFAEIQRFVNLSEVFYKKYELAKQDDASIYLRPIALCLIQALDQQKAKTLPFELLELLIARRYLTKLIQILGNDVRDYFMNLTQPQLIKLMNDSKIKMQMKESLPAELFKNLELKIPTFFGALAGLFTKSQTVAVPNNAVADNDLAEWENLENADIHNVESAALREQTDNTILQ